MSITTEKDFVITLVIPILVIVVSVLSPSVPARKVAVDKLPVFVTSPTRIISVRAPSLPRYTFEDGGFGVSVFSTSPPTDRNAISLSDDLAMGRAFDAIGLLRNEGFVFLNKAKEILESESFSCTATVPCISSDLEEDTKYLTVRLHANVSFEKSLELDSFLTKKLVASFARLPERLSFAVYETDGNAA